MKTIYINESQKKAIKSYFLLKENRNDDKVEAYIRANATPPFGSNITLDTPLSELPSYVVKHLNPGEGESDMYTRIKNNENGFNRFIDYLRINFYNDFGLTHGGKAKKYMVGIARIALEELNYYSFSRSMRTAEIMNLARSIRIISKHPELLSKHNIILDKNLNGLSYEDFIEYIKPAIDEYVNATKESLKNSVFETPAGYKIVEIKDIPSGGYGGPPCAHLTPESFRFLSSLTGYTDWCIAGDRHSGMYEQYTCGGGKFYICMKEGFENIPREPGENCPLDEYGLSLISVLVSPDGLPDKITTRWNHDYNGEDNDNLENAIQLQNILKVNYLKVFKPRPVEELRTLMIAEEKVPTAQEQVKNKVNAGVMDAACGTMEEASINENSYDRAINNYIKKNFGITDFNEIRKKVIDVYKKIPYARVDGGRYLIGVFRLLYEENLPKEQYNVLNKILYFIDKSDVAPDSNLDGMGFDELKKEFFKHEVDFSNDLNSYDKQIKCKNGYTVTRIDSYKECELRCDGEWCISYDESYWDDFSDETVYLVENESLINKNDEFRENSKEEYDNIVDIASDIDLMRENGYLDDDENFVYKLGSGKFPYDDYGLSRFVVLVYDEGFTVYSRYNLADGLDGAYLSKEEIESLLGVKFESVFKPVKNEVSEGADPNSDNYTIGIESGDKSISPDYHASINEEESKESFKKYFNEIGKFMKENGLNVYPFPKVKLDWSEQDGLFIKTGYYTPEEKSVTLFCKDRHPKDILRSFAHEMIHHAQNLDGKDLSFTSNDNVKDNKKLEKLEAEAYLKGNIFFRKWTEYANSKKKSLNESIVLDETNPEDVDLSSFNIKRELNPKFWKNNLLDSRIRMRLMDIADDFIEFLGVDWVKPDDVIMTGSLANYNWNKKYSDIDLHVLMDFSKVDKRKDFVKKYFDSLKNQWNETHEDLKIFGFPVEVYVQDTNEVHTSTGVYSIDKNKWVTKPEREKLSNVKVNKSSIKKKVSDYMNKIDDLVEDFKSSNGDDYKLSKISERANNLFDEIKNERRNSLNGESKNKSEITPGNIIFKCLRRLNYLDKLYNLKTKTYDKMNSLP